MALNPGLILAAAHHTAQMFARHEREVRAGVKDLCASVHIPPPSYPDIDNWGRLFQAMARKQSLLSILPSHLTEFTRYEDVLPVRSQQPASTRDEAGLQEAFSDAWQAILHLDELVAANGGPRPTTPVPRLEWYSGQHDKVTALKRWVDSEAAPVVAALVAAEDNAWTTQAGQTERVFALLQIPQLQKRLKRTGDAYAAEVTRARAQREARRSGQQAAQD